MARESYSDLLQDPRWQRKRLEILNRDGWACGTCKSTTNTLHVHHRYYAKGRKPWEYPDDALLTLCKECHAAVTDIVGEITRSLGDFDAPTLVEILYYVRGLRLWMGLEEFAGFEIPSADAAIGLSNAVGVGIRVGQEAIYDHAKANGGYIRVEDLARLVAKHYPRSPDVPAPADPSKEIDFG